MKKILFSLVLMLFVNITIAQIVSIGTGSEVSKAVPVEPYYGYTYSQSLYLASEINQTGTIYKIKFKGNSGLSINNTNDWVVYMATTSKTNFSSTTDWVALNDLTEVYQGTITVVNNDVEITLTTPFVYNGTDNLIIAVEDNQSGYDSTLDDFLASSVSEDRSIYYRNDSTNPDPASPPTGTIQAFIPNVDLDFTAITCPIPSALNSSNVTATTADISWTIGNSETAWNLEYGVTGFAQGSGTMVNNLSSTNHSLSSLIPNTTYQVYVQADCDTNGVSDWVGPIAFTTPCSAFTVSYAQNFDGETAPAVNDCWTTSIVGSSSSFAAVESTSFNRVSIPNSIRMSNSGDTDGTYYLISPLFSDLNATKQIKFMAYKNIGNDSEGDTIEIGTMTDANDVGTYTTYSTLNASDFDEDDWKQFIITFDSYTGNAGHIVIKYTPGTGTYNSWYFDDFSYEEIPTVVPDCATNYVATPDASCGNDGAVLSWDAVSEADGYKLTIGTTPGGNDVLNAQDLGNATTYTLATTMVNTTHYWAVIPYNAVGDATGCLEDTFTTLVDGCFCNSNPTSNDGNGIANTKVNTTDYAGADVMYQNHTATTVSIERSATTTVDITFETGYTYDVHIWVDLNDNFIFEPSERLYSGESTNDNPTILNATFTVPATAALGEHRMRIGTADNGQSTANPCYSGSYGVTMDFKVDVTNTLAIEEAVIDGLQYYPNPVENELYFTASEDLIDMTVYTLIGNKVYEQEINGQNFTADLSNLKTGLYILKVTANNKAQSFRIIKK